MNIKTIFDELCKGNINIIDYQTQMFISDIAQKLYKMGNSGTQLSIDDIETLKYLIMICNITYNRTDSNVLPVEDGVYDILNELYKKYDPNFQVGSAVIQFQSMAEREMRREGKEMINPFVEIENKPTDDISAGFRSEIKEFDRYRYSRDELLYDGSSSYIYDDNIAKRTHNTSHNHPELVGTLDKVKFVLDKDAIDKDVYYDDNVKILERDFFIKHINMGIIRPDEEIELVLELKYDGISVEADCTDIVQSARTRGDTGAGLAADITPMLYGYKFHQNNALKDRTVGVKFEAIMTKSDLARFNRDRGYNYANCRTAIVGLFGASDANLYRDYITLIPLALDRENVPEVTNRHEEIEILNRLYKTKGEPLRHVYIRGTYDVCLYLIKKFADEAKYAREYLNFMFDGIVVSYTDERIRNALGRENYINKYSIAVKFDPLAKLTTFLGYSFEVGQTGNICPMIHYAPVEFFGTIHPKSSGASLNRFNELSLRPGDIIEVVYTNDVMPRVNKIDCEQNRNNHNPLCEFLTVCPECGTPLVISDSGKSAYCPNNNCLARKIARMTNMLQKMGIKGFAESTIVQIGVYSFSELAQMKYDDIVGIGPTNASNFINAMHSLCTEPQDDYKIVGSLGFTNIGSRKWKLLLSVISLKELHLMILSDKQKAYEFINGIRGFGSVAANTIIEEYEFYKKDIEFIINNMNIINHNNESISGKKIRFSGCRNKQLEDQLRAMGHDADGSAGVTKDTDILIIPQEGYTSTKTGKVSSDCIIVPILEFMENMSNYLM